MVFKRRGSEHFFLLWQLCRWNPLEQVAGTQNRYYLFSISMGRISHIHSRICMYELLHSRNMCATRYKKVRPFLFTVIFNFFSLSFQTPRRLKSLPCLAPPPWPLPTSLCPWLCQRRTVPLQTWTLPRQRHLSDTGKSSSKTRPLSTPRMRKSPRTGRPVPRGPGETTPR